MAKNKTQRLVEVRKLTDIKSQKCLQLILSKDRDQ